MSGIYIHIPFCRQACNYCNFHFSTSLRRKSELVDCIMKEMELRKDFFKTNGSQLDRTIIETIYFGGGTPSVLETNELMLILDKVHELFEVAPNPEISIEANPDDLTTRKLKELKETPFNRLSIGIQSFHQIDLDYLNRVHSSAQAKEVLETCLDVGFVNLTVDLIFGIPTLTDKMWLENLDFVVERNIPHISVYGLTVEPKTPLELFIRKGKAKPVDEEQYARQFEITIDRLEDVGYEHYEISNFALPGMQSRHNTSYWTCLPYLGLGPSAHSFNMNQRSWNPPNTTKYIDSLKMNIAPLQTEVLCQNDQYNEYIMTSLRTAVGCNLDNILRQWGKTAFDTLLESARNYESAGLIGFEDGRLVLTKKGKLLADSITRELFI